MTRSLLLGLAVVLAPLASAQYSSDPAANLALSTEASDQNQPKLSPTQDGGTWLSWFDGIGSGWDVRIQRLDADGNEVFGSGGLLVADRSYSSTQDYDLATASNGDALLTYRNNPGGSDEIEAARVDTAGTVLWTTTVAAGAGFVAAPTITGTGTDQAVVGWTENSTVRLQGLDQAGNTTWGQGATLTPPIGSYSISNVSEGPQAGAIVSIVHQTGGFGSPRHLLAQRFNSLGVALWGAAPVAVFDSGSLQFGAFPECEVTTDGHSLFTWYSSSPSLQCFVQRLNAQGAALWLPGGLPVSDNVARIRTDPAAFHIEFSDTYVYWREQNLSQSEAGLYGQRINLMGDRLWGSEGREFVPVSPEIVSQVRAVRGSTPAFAGGTATWVASSGFGNDAIRALRIDETGQALQGPIDISTVASGKARLVSASATWAFGDWSLAAWSDDRNDGGDIYIQNLTTDGQLGGDAPLGTPNLICPTTANSTGDPAELLTFGSAVIADGDLTLQSSNLPPNVFGFYVTSEFAGFTPMVGGGQGNFCLGIFFARLNGPGQVLNSGPGGAFTLNVDMGKLPCSIGSGVCSVVSGQTQFFQAWFRDNNPQATSNLTNAVGVVGL